MAVRRPLLLLLQLLGLALGSNLNSASTNTSVHSPASSKLGNDSSQYNLSKNSSRRFRATPTNFLQSMTPSFTPSKFQHTVDSVPSAKSSWNFLVAAPTNISSNEPKVLSFDHLQGNHSTVSPSRPANLSDPVAKGLASQKYSNISLHNYIYNVSYHETMNTSIAILNTSSHQVPSSIGTEYPPYGNFSNPSNHHIINTSDPMLNTSLLRAPWDNDTYPAFKKISSHERPTNGSDSIPIELQLHRSRDNGDLYPPINSFNVTIKYSCYLPDISEAFRPRHTTADKMLRRSRRRQASENDDLYPPRSCAQRDVDFFEFTEENIRNSGVIEVRKFYPCLESGLSAPKTIEETPY